MESEVGEVVGGAYPEGGLVVKAPLRGDKLIDRTGNCTHNGWQNAMEGERRVC